MRTINISQTLSDEEADALRGTFLDDTSYDILVREDADVYKPDGSPLLKFRTGAIPAPICEAAYPTLFDAATPSRNRGMASGIPHEQLTEKDVEGGRRGSVKFNPLRKGGYKSNTNEAREVLSGIIGYFDRTPRMYFCRTTAYTLDNPEQFRAALPFIQTVNDVFQREMPDRYEAQRALVEQTHKAYIIEKTAFSTVTVNRNFQTAVHKDAGDLPEGFGVLTALRRGRYEGCYLCFPKYRVAVDMTNSAVLLCDVHEWHGNTPLRGKKGHYSRVSCVFYYRRRMAECGSPTEELRAVANRRGGFKNDPTAGSSDA